MRGQRRGFAGKGGVGWVGGEGGEGGRTYTSIIYFFLTSYTFFFSTVHASYQTSKQIQHNSIAHFPLHLFSTVYFS